MSALPEIAEPVRALARPAIGGVMPAAVATGPAGDLLAGWERPWAHRAAFGSARAALAALLAARQVRRVWLPAYICPALAEGAARADVQARYYPVSPRLEPDVTPLAAARSGDAVVCAAFFGRPCESAFRDIRQARPDMLWIEDRAQAADAAEAAWADAAIYSPRKLIGVADGGLLFAHAPVPSPSRPPAADWAPEDGRALDPDGAAPERWYGAFRAREAAVGAAPAAMSPRGLTALGHAAAGPLAAARRRNWTCLNERLADLALWPGLAADFTPLAFPILVADAAEAARALAAERIWAPRHWPRLPSPAAEFPQAHALSHRLLSLPCDQRYGAADMARMAEAVLRLAV